MSIVKYIHSDKTETNVEIEAGENIMSLAINNLVDGIVGECGGAQACATCHCYIDESYASLFSEKSELEEAMLEMVPDLKPTSRLSCQLELTDDLPNIVVELPESQY